MSNLKEQLPDKGLGELCELFGKKRQSYYEKLSIVKERDHIEEQVVALVLEKRKTTLKSLGGRKLIRLLEQDPEWHRLGVGRDRFFDILRSHKLLIRKKRSRKVKTTDSNHWLKKYPDLFKGVDITRAEQAWVSDITYIRTDNGFSYLFLITDAYSRRIMGHCLARNMNAVNAVKALEMAISARKFPDLSLLHHSDRGSQYCSYKYTEILKTNNISISMTQDGNPGDNALAERVNGIIKCELTEEKCYRSHEEADYHIEHAVRDYNTVRPHLSCDYLTPDQAHGMKGPLRKHWKDYSKNKRNREKQECENEFF